MDSRDADPDASVTTDLVIVFGLLAATIVMFAVNKPRMDIVALLMMTLLPLLGVVTAEEALAGFSDPNVVLIAALFVIGEGLVRTGVAQRLGDAIVRHSGESEKRVIALLMVVVAGLGSVMSSTGAVAIFIPAVLRVARQAGIPPGRLMMPLSVGALISGMMTLIGTPPNLVVHGELVRSGYEGFGFFSFTVFGVPVLAASIAYMVLVRRRLAADEPAPRRRRGGPRVSRWVEEYGLVGREVRLRLAPGSPWAGRRLDELKLRARFGINVLAIERQRPFAAEIVEPAAGTVLRVGDALYVDFRKPAQNLDRFCAEHRLQALPIDVEYFADKSRSVGMAELLIPAESSLAGKTAVEAGFRTRYRLSVIGVKRGTEPVMGDVQSEPLRAGDTLLVAGPWRAITRLKTDPNEIIVLHVPVEAQEVVPLPWRAPFALGVLAVVLGLMIFNVVPNVLAGLIGCFLLGVFRCVDVNAAYRSIQWPTVFLIVGMLPFSTALQKTGGVDLVVQALSGAVRGADPVVMLAALYGLTALLGLFISNTATAVLMAPVAIALAEQLGQPPHAFAMAVALASSAAFITPVSSPVNALVVGPGNYRFMDFVRIGLPLFFLVMVLSLVLIRLVYL